jgi:hypothetical protein
MNKEASIWAIASICMISVLLVNAESTAKVASSPRKPMPSEVYTNMLIKTGGVMYTPTEGASVLFVNTQKKIAYTILSGFQEDMKKILRFPMMISEQKQTYDVAGIAIEALKDKKIAAVIVICDIPGQPQMLVAPEARWVIVNVAALTTAGVTDEALALRVQKQLWRAFGYLMGAANSNLEGCVLKPVFSAEDLDSLKGKALSPEVLMKMANQASKMGIKPSRLTTYRKACEEGWAPMPTNSFQKAIWEEVKAKK